MTVVFWVVCAFVKKVKDYTQPRPRPCNTIVIDCEKAVGPVEYDHDGENLRLVRLVETWNIKIQFGEGKDQNARESPL